MRTHHAGRTRTTASTLDFVDITDEVDDALRESGIRNGHVTVFAGDPDCALIVNERESGLWHDLRKVLDRMEKERPYDRRAVIGSASVVVPAVDGRLHLGTWQRLLLVELGRPCDRALSVQIVGE